MTNYAEIDNKLAQCRAMAHMVGVACDKISDHDAAALGPMYVADNLETQIQEVRQALDAIEDAAGKHEVETTIASYEQTACSECKGTRRALSDMEVPLRELSNLLNVVAMTALSMCENSTTEFEGTGLHTLYVAMDSRAKTVACLWSDACDVGKKPDDEPVSAQEDEP